MKYYPDMRMKESMPFVTTQMNTEGSMLSGISQTEKEKYCMLSLMLKTKKNQTHRNRKQIGDCQGLGE